MTLPQSIATLLSEGSFEPFTIGESKSDVFKVKLLDGHDAFLKTSSAEHVVAEMKHELTVLEWLQGKLEAPMPIKFLEENGTGYLLMSAIPGKNLAEASAKLSSGECLSIGARYLRKIHLIPVKDCPFQRNLETTVDLAQENFISNLVDESDFDDARSGWAAERVYADLLKKWPKSEDLAFTHGDYCFPNIICGNSGVNGVVDLSRAGIADRHQDIALFLRSFEKNTNTKADVKLFLREYKLVSKLDEAKLEFFLILDEFF